MTPRISVVMPVYNTERFLAEAVESVLSQTFGSFEFIIIDDGSTDRTAEILRRYDDVRIVVGDGHRSRFDTFTVEVANVNRPPQIVARQPLFMREGAELLFTMEAGDTDGDPLTFSAGNLPDGAVFEADGQFAWTPDFEQAGDYVVTFTATDPSGLSDSTDVTIRIDNINRAPVLDTSFHAVRLGEELRFLIQAQDPDQGATLTYGASGLPDGATVDPITGEFVWTPGPG